jgi:hypothetical protein
MMLGDVVTFALWRLCTTLYFSFKHVINVSRTIQTIHSACITWKGTFAHDSPPVCVQLEGQGSPQAI